MRKLLEFDGFSTYNVRVYSRNGVYIDPEDIYREYPSRSVSYLVRYPELKPFSTESIASVRLKFENALRTTPLKPGESLYIHPNCVIPRSKVTAKYKRVLNPLRATACVVPSYVPTCYVEPYAIFINKAEKCIFLISARRWENNKGTVIKTPFDDPSTVGKTATEIFNDKRGVYSFNYSSSTMVTFAKFRESVLWYYGNCYQLETNQLWVKDLIEGNLHNIVKEEEVLKSLGDNTNALSEEMVISLMEMIQSSDADTAELGLKTLAELDYTKYRNTTVYILNTTINKRRDLNANNAASVQCMYKFLGMKSYNTGNYSKEVVGEDFELLKIVLKKDLKERIACAVNQFKYLYPFCGVSINTDIMLSPEEGFPKIAFNDKSDVDE